MNTPAPTLCPRWCIAALVKAYPERQTGSSEEYEPFFRWPNGTPVKRESIRDWVRLMVVKAGLKAHRGNSHSLRTGGATALYADARPGCGEAMGTLARRRRVHLHLG